MSIRHTVATLLAAIGFAGASFAQGFAGLGGEAKGFASVVPGIPIVLPADFGPHPGHRIEWWYVTANLVTETGLPLGVQWTLFRQATKPGTTMTAWSTSEFWMGHAAITNRQKHLYAQKLARGGTGQAGAHSEKVEAWIDNWKFVENADAYTLKAGGDTFSYDLQLAPTGPVVRHGNDGYSVKSDQGQASYYFSHPFLQVAGTITIDGQQIAVTGSAWLDREWSSQPLASNQKGWDWFSLKLEGGERLMLFALRDDDGGTYRSGSWIAADGTLEPLTGDDIELTPLTLATVADRKVPTRWRVEVASKDVDLEVSALNEQSWMATSIAYWEGPVTAAGSHEAVGYLEMTGY